MVVASDTINDAGGERGDWESADQV